MEFWDDYEHADPSQVEYIVESVKSAKMESSSRDSGQIQGCNCSGLCNVESSCVCVSRSGSHYQFDNVGEINRYTLAVTNDKPSYECSDSCKCRNRFCGHRLVQFGPNKHLQITKVDMTGKGLGLITTNPIKSNTFICEYVGEIVSQSEVLIRFQRYKDSGLNRNYIFCINENFGEANYRTYIDPTLKGNIGRYINHSCEPNCTLIPIRTEDIAVPKLCIFAKCDLDSGVEITFNYGELNKSQIQTGENNKLKKCLCSSRNCKQFLPYDVDI